MKAYCTICNSSSEVEAVPKEVIWSMSCGHLIEIVSNVVYPPDADKVKILNEVVWDMIDEKRNAVVEVSKILDGLLGPKVHVRTD